MSLMFSILAAAAAFASNAGIRNGGKTDDGIPADAQGHVLVSKWKDYSSAAKADRPQKQLDILSDIKEEASSKRLLWDWYDAARRYVDVSVSRNWKLYEGLNTQLSEDVLKFGEPLLVFYHRSLSGNAAGELLGYVRDNAAALKSGCHRQFYKEDYHISDLGMAKVLLEEMSNDYEYALWSLRHRVRDTEAEAVSALLTEELGGAYPRAAYLEFLDTPSEGYGSFAEKYEGKAVALFARQEMLQTEFDDLVGDNSSNQERYKALRTRCGEFEKTRKAFTGEEKKVASCCRKVSDLIGTLDAKSCDMSVKDGVLSVRFRNVSQADVRIGPLQSGQKTAPVYSTIVRNPDQSYYVVDTVDVILPSFDDGDYMLSGKYEGGKKTETFSTTYLKRSVSLLSRDSKAGHAIYAADYKTGKPVRHADIIIKDGDKTLYTVRDFTFDGMTMLPSEADKIISEAKRHCNLTCRYRDESGVLHLSDDLGSYQTVYADRVYTDQLSALILTDRTLYKPGEDLQFKAVIYQGNRHTSIKPAGTGTSVKAVLKDTEGKEVAGEDLKANDFGSVAGAFTFPKDRKNGMFRLELYQGRLLLDQKIIRVDDVVLPTFEITWEDNDALYLPGDTIRLRGRVKSYSGHSLSDATVSAHIRDWHGHDTEKGIALHADGTFSLEFESSQKQEYCFYRCIVKVVDGTGETMESQTGITVNDSINPVLTVGNSAGGRVLAKDPFDGSSYIIRGEEASLTVQIGKRDDLALDYTLTRDGRMLSVGKASPGSPFEVSLPGPSGEYVLELNAKASLVNGKECRSARKIKIVKLSENDRALDADVENVFCKIPGDDIALQVGSTNGPTWIVVDVFGSPDMLIDSRLIYLDGKKGTDGSLTTLRYGYKPEYGRSVRITARYFRNGEHYSYDEVFENTKDDKLALPLAFTRFEDKTAPGSPYVFKIQTDPGVECAAAIFDKSTLLGNDYWQRLTMSYDTYFNVSYREVTGADDTDRFPVLDDDVMVMGYGSSNKARTKGASLKMAGMATMESANAAVMMDNVGDEAEVIRMEEAPVTSDGYEVAVRDNFAKTIAFEPFLRSDDKGEMDLTFTTGDKLSTFVVQLFAHDTDMRNAVLHRDMVVSVPVKVSLVEPQLLYAGDKYVLKAMLSSNETTPVRGKMLVSVYEGSDYREARPLFVRGADLTVSSGSAVPAECEIDVPAVDTLGLKLSFISESGAVPVADAVFVAIPVHKPEQTLTEAHSSVFLSGDDRDAIVAELRSSFVNADASDLPVQEIAVMDMVREAVPDMFQTECKDLLSVSEALYAGLLAQKIDGSVVVDVKGLESKVLACRNDDGGFGWFEGMTSSPILTAVLLQRLSGLSSRALESGIPTLMSMAGDAVRYLDRVYFADDRLPYWRGFISMEQYLYVRSMYGSVPFSVKDASAKRLRDFRKDARAYLVPSKDRGLQYSILAKARRMMTLRNLVSRDAADVWGLALAGDARMVKSWRLDMESLLEYAVRHKSGGIYYPNAVMPWRGLMESELTAHSVLCDLMSGGGTLPDGSSDSGLAARCGSIADGIRLWIMLQKETQQWSSDPAYVDAIASVLDGSDEILSTKVLTMSARYTKPFDEISAAGNGFTVKRTYVREGVELKEGDVLEVGDKITARYDIWNEENRSFVMLSAPRPACLRPVDQLSGHIGWWRVTQGYRNVLADRTEYWYDAYPEEKTTVTEEFYVTQKGVFQSPVISIESLYAPHYRANDGASHRVTVAM